MSRHAKTEHTIKLFLIAAAIFIGAIATSLTKASEDTPFLKAVRSGTYPDVQRTLTKESIHDRDQYGNTAIMLAASRGYNNTMRLLIKQGGDVHATNSSGVTALMIAASAGRVSQLAILLKHGVDIEARDAEGKTALLYAAGAKGSAALDTLLTHGADPGVTDNQGNTAMIHAASVNSVGSLYALAEYDQSYDKTNKRGQSPLFIAAANGSLEAVKALIEHGASVDQVSSAGETPLMIAVYKKYPNIVRTLLDADADRNLVSNTGHTPISLANTYGDAEMKSLFDKRVEGNRITMHADLSADVFKTSAGELLDIAVLNGPSLAVDEGRYIQIYGGMPLSEFIKDAAQSGIKPVMIEDNLFRIGNLPTGIYAFRNDKLLGFVTGRSARKSTAHEVRPEEIKPKETKPSQTSSDALVFAGDILSLIGGAKPQPVISKDAPIFKAPPITKGAGFLYTAPGGLYQIFKGTLLAFEKDIAEVLVKNAIQDTDATVRCRVSVNTKGIHYAFESGDSRAELLKRAAFGIKNKNATAAISSDTVRKWINKPVSIAPAGEICAHFELL
jgi:ankyrin repeat protein